MTTVSYCSVEHTGKLASQSLPQSRGLFSGWSLTLFLLSCFAFPEKSSAASIKCWQNKQKIRECGQIVPQEYSQDRIEILNERGIVIKIISASKTKQQREQDAKQKQKEQARELARQRRQEQDEILLQTFTTERDLLQHRKANLNAITSIINLSKGKSLNLSRQLTKLRKNAGDYERGGQKVPAELVQEIKQTERQIGELAKYITEKNTEKTAMAKRFDDDLLRFRKLKNIKPH